MLVYSSPICVDMPNSAICFLIVTVPKRCIPHQNPKPSADGCRLCRWGWGCVFLANGKASIHPTPASKCCMTYNTTAHTHSSKDGGGRAGPNWVKVQGVLRASAWPGCNVGVCAYLSTCKYDQMRIRVHACILRCYSNSTERGRSGLLSKQYLYAFYPRSNMKFTSTSTQAMRAHQPLCAMRKV